MRKCAKFPIVRFLIHVIFCATSLLSLRVHQNSCRDREHSAVFFRNEVANWMDEILPQLREKPFVIWVPRGQPPAGRSSGGSKAFREGCTPLKIKRIRP